MPQRLRFSAAAAYRHLRSVDAHAFELLTQIPVRFHRMQKEFERLLVAPVIRVWDREVVQRFTYDPPSWRENFATARSSSGEV